MFSPVLAKQRGKGYYANINTLACGWYPSANRIGRERTGSLILLLRNTLLAHTVLSPMET